MMRNITQFPTQAYVLAQHGKVKKVTVTGKAYGRYTTSRGGRYVFSELFATPLDAIKKGRRMQDIREKNLRASLVDVEKRRTYFDKAEQEFKAAAAATPTKAGKKK